MRLGKRNRTVEKGMTDDLPLPYNSGASKKHYGRHKRPYPKEVKRRHRRTREKGPSLDFPKPRFPRLKKGDLRAGILNRLHELRVEYPPPVYDPWRDGAYNPTEVILAWTVKLNIGKLRERCRFHGLSDFGDRFELTKKLYLHFRSTKLKLGYPLVAYGKDHEKVNVPQCSCGVILKKVKRFPRNVIYRFPRTIRFPRPFRFPRLPANPRFWDPPDFEIVAAHMTWYERATGRKPSIMEYCDTPPRFPREEAEDD